MTTDTVTPFLFEGEITVRVIDREGVPWFVSADACRALGVANPSQAVEGLDDDEKGICSISTPGGAQQMLVISEGGLFTLILRCRGAMKRGTLPHRFRRWVTGEVLPCIRRQVQERTALLCGAQAHPPEALRVRLVAEARQTFGTRAAAELWFSLNLPVVAAMHAAPDQPDLFLPFVAPPSPSASSQPPT